MRKASFWYIGLTVAGTFGMISSVESMKRNRIEIKNKMICFHLYTHLENDRHL